MKEKNGEHPLGDAGQLIALVVFLAVWVTDSFFLRISTFLSYSLPPIIQIVIVSAMFFSAIYLLKSGHVVLKHEHRGKILVTSGAFRFVRHPIYLASILTYFALAISTVSLFSIALWVGIFIFHDYIAGYEEALLTAKYGDKYREYKERTGKWLPRIRRTHAEIKM